jgi:hypothetical protein
MIKFDEKHGNVTDERNFGPTSIKETINHWKMQEKELKLLKKDKRLFFLSVLQNDLT